MLSRFAIVVPVKPPVVGKSRLRGVQDSERRRLAEAFAVDTITTCLAAGPAGVLVTTDDASLGAAFAGLGCATVPDGDSNDLNAALEQAAADAVRRWPGTIPVAICADLPALRTADLGAALAQLPDGPAFVADADGSGTTLYAAPPGRFRPRFGHDSRSAHLAAGAVEIHGALPSLRRDVDDLDDLRSAVALGVGDRTRALWQVLDDGMTTDDPG